MKCPHCSASIGLFSQHMKDVAQAKACPFCGKGCVLGLIPSRFVLGFAPIALASIVLGVSGPIAAGIAGGVGAAVGMGLKRTKD